LGALLADGRAHGIVADVDWSRFRPIYESRGERRLFAELDGATPIAKSTSKEPRLLDELRRAPNAERRRLLERRLQAEVAKTLGLGDPSRLDLYAGFREQGLDSLMAVELRNLLNAELGVTLSAVVTFNHPTVSALAAYLLEELALSRDRSGLEPAAPNTETPAERAIADLTDEEAARLLEQEIASLEEELR
jgi:epothilone polyketide synthase D